MTDARHFDDCEIGFDAPHLCYTHRREDVAVRAAHDEHRYSGQRGEERTQIRCGTRRRGGQGTRDDWVIVKLHPPVAALSPHTAGKSLPERLILPAF